MPVRGESRVNLLETSQAYLVDRIRAAIAVVLRVYLRSRSRRFAA